MLSDVDIGLADVSMLGARADNVPMLAVLAPITCQCLECAPVPHLEDDEL